MMIALGLLAILCLVLGVEIQALRRRVSRLEESLTLLGELQNEQFKYMGSQHETTMAIAKLVTDLRRQIEWSNPDIAVH